jgi:hypothetical protein
MIEAGAAQQPRRVQHQATSQILELRAREARNVRTDALRTGALLPAFVFTTQMAPSAGSEWVVRPLYWIMRRPRPGFAAGREIF